MSLAFGTGGLRGIMGYEPNQINEDVIKHVTHALAKVVFSYDFPKSVCISYDTRFNSKEYANIVSEVLSTYGITVYSFDKPMPTPALSFMIRHKNLGWGVAITASHNPQEYNGYKVYDHYGVQLTDKMAMEIMEAMKECYKNDILDFKQSHKKDAIFLDPAPYFEQVINYVNKLNCQTNSIPIVYSALYGAGANAVPYALKELGFDPICIQQAPDGSFGGIKTPNPEEMIVYEKAIETAIKNEAKLILATDPDCDRVGVIIKTKDGFLPMSGNQIGALLIDYLAQTRGVNSGDTVISTIVSGLLGEKLADEYGLEFVRLLTGFKYIGEYAVQLPKDKQFFFGYEESYGFLAGDGVRDKDAVIASALIAKMTAYYDEKGLTLFDRFIELSEKHGYCLEKLHSININSEEQNKIMQSLRNGIEIDGLINVEDYKEGIKSLPKADVIKLYFENNSWAAFRPSGTEPKMKIYMGVKEDTYEKAEISLDFLCKNMLLLAKKL
ncbi:MAG: phospho-sugar mutase [Oscillospiraceae bacterium]|jgi:phosphoglucomutase|nr:phospho-sugar mutase [Oscillospiraceae bacterium]